ncbi:MAG: aminotransferase class V-fold PLP-dependent enzyme [Saprospiraceae bacterium]|nr:aminotransferase class V-fold PLP-dependent enzyme [Saprospiraceae bacterium]
MQAFTSEQISQFRKETPGTDQIIHLNNAGAALMPELVKASIDQFLTAEYLAGGYETAADQRAGLDAFYSAVAKLLNTASSNIAFLGNATDAYNKALSCIPFEKGDVILTSLNDYSSNQIAFLQLKKLRGVKIVFSQDLPTGGLDPVDMIQKMEFYQPKLVAVTHVPTNSGLIQEAAQIGRACQDRGIYFLLDACQSAGQLVLDVKALGCDFLSATTRKFLRGPRGTGFLYVSNRVLNAKLSPLFLDLHSAAWNEDDQYTPREDAKRFELWEKPYALMFGAAKAIEYANNIGLDRIEQQVKYLSDYLRASLSSLPKVRVLDQGIEKAGLVTFTMAGQDPVQLQQQLRKQGINTSHTTLAYNRYDMKAKQADWLLRLSPHYYNTLAELDRTLEFIAQL